MWQDKDRVTVHLSLMTVSSHLAGLPKSRILNLDLWRNDLDMARKLCASLANCIVVIFSINGRAARRPDGHNATLKQGGLYIDKLTIVDSGQHQVTVKQRPTITLQHVQRRRTSTRCVCVYTETVWTLNSRRNRCDVTSVESTSHDTWPHAVYFRPVKHAVNQRAHARIRMIIGNLWWYNCYCLYTWHIYNEYWNIETDIWHACDVTHLLMTSMTRALGDVREETMTSCVVLLCPVMSSLAIKPARYAVQ